MCFIDYLVSFAMVIARIPNSLLVLNTTLHTCFFSFLTTSRILCWCWLHCMLWGGSLSWRRSIRLLLWPVLLLPWWLLLWHCRHLYSRCVHVKYSLFPVCNTNMSYDFTSSLSLAFTTPHWLQTCLVVSNKYVYIYITVLTSLYLFALQILTTSCLPIISSSIELTLMAVIWQLYLVWILEGLLGFSSTWRKYKCTCLSFSWLVLMPTVLFLFCKR